MNNIFSKDFAGRSISIKANYMAGQADGSVLVTYGDTVVIVTAVSNKKKREGVDFLPLTVDYQEMTFAAGKIPGGFFKREGRPNEKEILTSRIIDRSIRPLFPKGYFFETQIVASVLSMDNENDSVVTALLGASAALAISDIPFNGPIASVRVGRVDGKFVVNPSAEVLVKSDFNLFIVGRKVSPGPGSKEFDTNLVMLEGEALEVEEDVIVDAINFGLESLRPVIEFQDHIRQTIGKEKRVVDAITVDELLLAKVTEKAKDSMKEAYTIPGKQDRHNKLDWIREKVVKEVCAEDDKLGPQVSNILSDLERHVVRDMILHDKKRSDGRTSAEIRPISAEVGILPRAHGSALFTRGETQALAALTLGTSSDQQRLDYVSGEEMRTFILHYNFPPFSFYLNFLISRYPPWRIPRN